MPFIATKTLEAIAREIEKDQGARYRGILRKTMPQVEDAYRDEQETFRSHLGASLIGRPCAREIWYSWHWTTPPLFDGRMLRLFNRGHLEEGRMAALLLLVGCELYQFDENGKQFRMRGHEGHYGGGLDGVIKNLPDIPDKPVLGEFKTHNDKSFQKVKSEGVRSAKIEHFAQMQQYMGAYQLEWAAYFAVNKNDDELYAELVPFDRENQQRFYDRAGQIVAALDPPPKINQSPGWWQCKFCDQSGVCHGSALPARNCRTCLYGTPMNEGKWVCANEATSYGDLSKDMQLKGCELYQLRASFKQ